ncbi:MAG: peptidoglycan-binding protein [Peptoniphilaceae bacterium]|nr:peptidoglycan-binding protein [Peptoniphilaceae bacterium]MDY6018938.1 peptidoglycan-binding protein [Anaerococcus sp.]
MNNKLKVTGLALALSLTFAACSNNKDKKENASSTSSVETNASTDQKVLAPTSVEKGSAEKVEMSDALLHRSYQTPHGDKSIARVVVLTSGDKIVDVSLDEMQYFDKDSDFVGLPSSDGAFGKGAAEGKILGSKVENSDAYSKNMAEKAGSKVSLADNYKAIIDFAKGKTISELEDVLANANEDGTIDGVTGATLADTANYIKAIVATAKDDKMVSPVKAKDINKVSLYQKYGAPHGDQSFADVVVAVEDGVIVAANIDELQYFGENGIAKEGTGFTEGYADQKNQLASKLMSNEEYSKLMAEKAGSKHSLADNYKAIENFAVGKTTDEIQSVIDESEKGKPVDAVSEATLVDTANYLQLIVDAVKEK